MKSFLLKLATLYIALMCLMLPAMWWSGEAMHNHYVVLITFSTSMFLLAGISSMYLEYMKRLEEKDDNHGS